MGGGKISSAGEKKTKKTQVQENEKNPHGWRKKSSAGEKKTQVQENEKKTHG